MQVHLRLRPLSEAERKQAGEREQLVIAVESQQTVRVHAPEASQSYKNGERIGTFTFSRVFDESVSQAQLFDAILAQPVAKAVATGKHAHVFAYGELGRGRMCARARITHALTHTISPAPPTPRAHANRRHDQCGQDLYHLGQ